MTRIVNIESVIDELQTAAYSETFDITFDETDILTTADFLNEIATNYFEMSYISHKDKTQDVLQFVNMWGIYKARHESEWLWIYNQIVIPPETLSTFSETQTITPNLTNATTNTYGRTSTNSGGISSTISHGKVVTGQTNTYDGALRDGAKTTESGTTGNSTTDTTKNTLGGSDSATTTMTGTSTVKKSGYRENPYDLIQKSIEFNARFNLRDMIINGFTKEFLFYDNGNGGDEYCSLLI